MNYTKYFSLKKTKQNQAIPKKNQVKNNAGGYVFRLDKWKQFERFLILGTEGGTYYVKENKLTIENAENIIECIKEDGLQAVELIKEISLGGRTPKNDPAIFALALSCAFGNQVCKSLAYASIRDVCRIGTHLFQFCQYIQELRGWSRGLRNGVANFYYSKSIEQLGYQLIKYKQRNGWTHKDVLRLAHPTDKEKNNLFKYAVDKEVDLMTLPLQVQAAEAIQHESSASINLVINLVKEYNLPRECLPTSWLNSKEVWEAMLPAMPVTALLRNLGKMTSIGVFTGTFDETTKVAIKKLTDKSILKKGRVHPLAVLTALKTYSCGHGIKGSLTWDPVNAISAALEQAFYLSFDLVEPTNKNYLIGLDVSASMGWENIVGSPLTPAEAAAAMCMTWVKTEPACDVIAFADTLRHLQITKNSSLNDTINTTSQMSFGNTDCSIPMRVATEKSWPIDVFVVLTDNETWYGTVHPCQALEEYRKQFKCNAKLVVVAMTSTGFSIADPKDGNSLDVVGFDTNIPQLISEFVNS